MTAAKKVFAAAPEGDVVKVDEVKTHRVLYCKADRSASWHPIMSLEQGDPSEEFTFAAQRVAKINEAIARGAVAPEFKVATERKGKPV